MMDVILANGDHQSLVFFLRAQGWDLISHPAAPNLP